MKFLKAIGLLIIYILTSVSFIFAQQRTYTIWYETCQNCNTISQSYSGTQVEFTTYDISSDFGRRRSSGNSKWHKGVDYSNNHQYVGDHLFSVFDGNVSKIFVTSSFYKIIVIDGLIEDLGYGHIFEQGPITASGMKYGDMVIKEMDGAVNQGKYAIINLSTRKAIGEINGATVTYPHNSINPDDVYIVNEDVTYDEPIAVLGRSGGYSPGHEYPYHLHLYRFKDISIVNNSTLGYRNIVNAKDPFEIINHTNTTYDVLITTDNNVNTNKVITSSGTDEISIRIRYTMIEAANPPPIGRFNDAVMDIDNVDLFIKPIYKLNETDYTNWGNENSNYKLIRGEFVDSHLSHGARFDSELYPIKANTTYNYNANPPSNTVIDITGATYGSFTSTGIDPFAYTSGGTIANPNNKPYDDYYFSDFYTRVKDNYTLGGTHTFASCNEEAMYPDDKYELFSRVVTVRDDIYSTIGNTPTEIIIDNFHPFIKNVELRKQLNGTPAYSRSWLWNGNTYLFEPPPCPACPDIKTNDYLFVKIYTSEAMDEVTLIINNHTISNTAINDDKTQWDFEIAANQLIVGSNTLEIDGKDLATNPIIYYPPHIPIRQTNTNNPWQPSPAPYTDVDENHTFFVTTPGPVDFSATQIGTGLRNIYFEDKSTIQDIETYNWDFGDGESTTIHHPNSPNLVHDYTVQGTYEVTYSVLHSGGSDFIEKNVLVDNLISPEAEYIYSILTQNGKANDEVIVDFYDESQGVINSWFWEFGNGVTSTHQNPKGIVLDSYIQYEIKLEVSNYLGTSTIIKDFYYDPTTSPLVQIIDWQQYSFYYNFDIFVDNLDGPYNYEIEYGDGTSETILSENLNWVTFDHQYFNWGTYLVKAYVTGTNLQGDEETVFTAKEITVSDWDLDVQLSFTAPTSPPYPGCQDVTIFADVSGAGNVDYWGTWYIYKIGDPSFYYSVNSPSGTSIDPLIYSFETEGTYKIGFNASTLVYGGTGHDEIIIVVENAPQYIDAGFYPLEPIQLGTNSTQTFYSNTWPVGNPGVTESQWYPTNLKWTLFDSEENIIQEDEEQFDYDKFFLEHPQEYTFPQNGTYKVRLEAWNNTHNYVDSGFINPECVNTVSYYDYVEKVIEVNDNIPYLEIIYPTPPQCLISLSAAAHEDIEITLTNPGEEPMTWNAIKSPGYNGNDFFSDPILSNTTISGGTIGIANFNVYENILDEEDNYGVIQVTGFDSGGNHVQGSPTYVVIQQENSFGPWEQYVYNDPPIQGENFGTAVGVDDKYAIIGAVDDNDNGKAYIAERDNIGYWHVVATLQAEDGYTTKFGRSVDIHGEYAIVGAYEHYYIFKKPASGWSGTLNSIADGYMNYNSAHDVSIWGDYAAVSISDLDHVKILYRNQQGITDSWNICELLTGESGTNFGYKIDLYNDLLAVGVPNKDKGEIHIFNRNHNNPDDWGLEHTVTPPDYDEPFLGGKGFDLSDNHLLYSYRGPFYNIYLESRMEYRDEEGIWSAKMIPSSHYPYTPIPYLKEMERPQDYVSASDFYNLAGKHSVFEPRKNSHISEYSGLVSQEYDIPVSQYYNDIIMVGGSACDNEFGYTVAPNWYQGELPAWNTGSMFSFSLESDFNSVVAGGPNKNCVNCGDENNYNVDDCGAVYFRDHETRELCAASIELDFINFEKPAGNYSDVSAMKITLGGKGYDAIIRDGANITYTAEEIVLDDGFLAEYGSEFVADTVSCHEEGGKSMLPDNYGAINEHSFVDDTIMHKDNLDLHNILVLNLQNIRKQLSRNYPSYPFHQIDFINGIEQIDVVDTSYNVVSTIKKPNPVICIFDTKTLPDEYHIIIKVEGKSFLLSSYKSPALRAKEQTLEQVIK